MTANRSSPSTVNGALPLETRLVALVIAPVLLLAFVLLYLLPDRTEELFAWTIKPVMTPLWMGGGYLAGTYVFMHVLFTKRWHTVAPMLIGVIVFVCCMALATLLHWDRFNHSHPMFYLWAGVYAVSPLLVSVLVLRNRRLDTGQPDPVDTSVPLLIRLLMAAVFAVHLVLGLMAFVFPATIIAIWPWALTPLTARVIGGWLLVPGVGGLAMTMDRRWSGWRVTMQTAALWWALNLLGVLRAWADFNPASPNTWIFIGATGLLLLGYVVLYLFMEVKGWLERSRRVPQTIPKQ